MVGWARAIRATESAQGETIILRTALPNSLRQYFKLKTVVGCRQIVVLASQRGSQLWEVAVVKSKTESILARRRTATFAQRHLPVGDA